MVSGSITTQSDVLRGVVTAIYHSSPEFSAGRIRTDEGRNVRFAGPALVQEDDPVSLHGRWEVHEKYGLQFAVERIGPPVELDATGLVNYLANHPEIRGIGPAKAAAIAEAFGSEFDHVIRDNPEAVASVARVPLKTILNAQSIWIDANDLNATMSHLAAYGLTHHQITLLVARFGNQVVQLLKLNPYLLINELPGFGFRRTDKIARRFGTPKALPSRIRAGILYALSDALDGGDCWVERDHLFRRADELLVLDTLNSRELIEGELRELIAAGRVGRHHLRNREVICLPEIFEMEEFLADVFRRGARRNPHCGVLRLNDTADLNNEQRSAVQNALYRSISLITGGAGTGKTFTVRAILDACEAADLSCTLAAPTGKAARRMEQAVGRSAQTIHRLLGYNGRTYLMRRVLGTRSKPTF